MSSARALSVAVVLGVGACTMGPGYERPFVPTPETHRDAEASAVSVADMGWWSLFHDETLACLVREALANNQDLAIALARVSQARAAARIAGADRFPQLEADVGAARTQSSGATSLNFGPRTSNDWRATTSVNWELDLWGRVRRGHEAALADYVASDEGRRAAVVTLVGDVSEAYFALRDLDAELEIARATHKARLGTSELFAKRHASGVSSELETAQATADLAGAAAVIPDLEMQVAQQENRLSELLGRSPGPIERGAGVPCEAPPQVPAGLPSCLLERRPDVRQAEAQVMAANARVGVAQAERFPRVSLTGLLGVESAALKDIATSPAAIWSYGAGLTAPIFEGGRLAAGRDLAVAQWYESVAVYRKTAQTAFREVADELVAVRRLRDVRTELEKQVEALRSSLSLSSSRYEGGLSAYFEVLDAQRRLFPAEIALARTRRDQCLALVRLYRALGGGWTEASGTCAPAGQTPAGG